MSGFRVEIDGGIATVTIDRPKANAIDAATSRALGEVFGGFEHDADVRVAIVTGAGERFFSAGWDLGAAADGEAFDSDYGAGGFGGYPDLPGRRTPVIAAVNGMAVGGGFEMVMAADLIVAADHAVCWLPEAALGMLPDAASVRLPRLLPPHLAREVLIAGRRLTAADLLHHGLAARVVPATDLMRVARELAARVLANAPLSVTAILDIIRRTADMDPIEAMTAIKQFRSYRAAIDSEDALEGTRSFEEQRPPVWKGR